MRLLPPGIKTNPCRILQVFLCLGVLKLALLGGMILSPQTPDPTEKPAMMSLPAISEAIAAPEENNAAKSEEKNEQDLSVSEEMARLREKRNRLEKKEKNLNKLEQEVNQKIQKLKKLQANIQQMLDEAKVVKDKKIKHLVDVYSNMKPKQAAQVLETLDQDIAVKILAGMRGRTAGEILSYVQADKAAQLSEDLTRLQMPFDQ